MLCDKCCDRIEPRVLWGSREGVSRCLGKSGKPSQRRGHLGSASKAHKTEKAGRDAQAEGTAFERAWGHERML